MSSRGLQGEGECLAFTASRGRQRLGAESPSSQRQDGALPRGARRGVRPRESAGQGTASSGHWFSLILAGGDEGKGPTTTHPAAHKQSHLCVSDFCMGRRKRDREVHLCSQHPFPPLNTCTHHLSLKLSYHPSWTLFQSSQSSEHPFSLLRDSWTRGCLDIVWSFVIL